MELNIPFAEIVVDANMVIEAIKELGLNKSAGMDGITAEHLKYASKELPYLLSMCITSCFSHGYLPESMFSVIIAPVIKDKAGNINTKDNHRPIALASIISKVVEIIMLNHMETYLITQHNQFGFKKRPGKELVNRYKAKGSGIYT